MTIEISLVSAGGIYAEICPWIMQPCQGELGHPGLKTVPFEFHLLDKSTKPGAQEEVQYHHVNHRLEEKPIQALTPTRKAAINVVYPALHPISTKWNNKAYIHSCLRNSLLGLQVYT